ncbi:hypothetical protein WN51_04244 [Melipona quadrifasciata]|uniref:Uncharacterized protein n=1 Tax=Melipona quadrifasciata TaxID=166423 RepID=A0A0M8ZU57_9HYME|nr:hypothetical protein WN51_04244 [Melipona quadrifasciata]
MCLLFFIVWIGIWCSNVVSSSGLTRELETTGSKSVVRSKRAFEGEYLVFPEGSNVQLVYCMTISTYTKPQGFFNIGLTAGQAWQLPSKSTLSNKLGDYHRRSRRQLYRKMELLLESQGKDGKACVLKTICNAAGRSQTQIGKGHFMQEILHATFSLPASYNDADPMTEYERAYFLKENCNEARRKCTDVF